MVKCGKCRMCGKRRKVLAISDTQLERDLVCFECLAALASVGGARVVRWPAGGGR